jgi:hypothetical protein
MLLLIVLTSGAFHESAEAKLLSRSELRQLGYSGVYRGTATGGKAAWNGVTYVPAVINDNIIERIPAAKQALVPGPTNFNQFIINHFPASGGERSIKINGTYSGVAFNSFYSANAVGSGKKTILVRRRGDRRPTFSMTTTYRFNENAQIGGFLFSYLRARGKLQ